MTEHITTTTLNPSQLAIEPAPESIEPEPAPAATVKPKRGRGRPKKAAEPAAETVTLTEQDLALLGRLGLMAAAAGMHPDDYVREIIAPLVEVHARSQSGAKLIY